MIHECFETVNYIRRLTREGFTEWKLWPLSDGEKNHWL